jgi:hypothetical protein
VVGFPFSVKVVSGIFGARAPSAHSRLSELLKRSMGCKY